MQIRQTTFTLAIHKKTVITLNTPYKQISITIKSAAF